jgi:hypothetical protein
MPPVVPYDRMFPFLFLEIHQDKANEILALFDKYKVCYPQFHYHFFFPISSVLKII